MNPIEYNSEQYKQSRCDRFDSRVKAVIPLIGRAGRVLDIGCLDGTIGELFLTKGNIVYGIDASQPAVNAALARGIKARIGDAEKRSTFEDCSFDAVFAGEIIEHVFDIDAMLEEVRRVLKPGGTFVVTTPNLAAFGRRMMLLCGISPHVEISFTEPGAAGHIRYFVKDNLIAILEKHGFEKEVFRSDVINFNASGSLYSCTLADWFPTLGRSLIIKAIKR